MTKRAKIASIIFWLILLIIAWEIGANVVAATKRTPENILPHLYQIIEGALSGQSCGTWQCKTDTYESSLRIPAWWNIWIFICFNYESFRDHRKDPFSIFNADTAYTGFRTCSYHPFHNRGYK